VQEIPAVVQAPAVVVAVPLLAAAVVPAAAAAFAAAAFAVAAFAAAAFAAAAFAAAAFAASVSAPVPAHTVHVFELRVPVHLPWSQMESGHCPRADGIWRLSALRPWEPKRPWPRAGPLCAAELDPRGRRRMC